MGLVYGDRGDFRLRYRRLVYRTTGPVRKDQGVLPHYLGKPRSRLKDLADTIRLDQPFGYGPGPEQLVTLTSRHKTHDGGFVVTQTGATRLMVMNRSPGVALHAFQQRGKSGQGLLPLTRPEQSGEFVPD
jgi:hypothetical protein